MKRKKAHTLRRKVAIHMQNKIERRPYIHGDNDKCVSNLSVAQRRYCLENENSL